MVGLLRKESTGRIINGWLDLLTQIEIGQSIKIREPINLSVTASLGVATYPDDCQDLYDLMQLADEAMSLGSKKNVRNRVTAYDKEGALIEKTD